MSNNIKWTFKKRYEQGKPNRKLNVYGYYWEGDNLLIDDEEAIVVKRIFASYLDGKARREIARELTAEGITSHRGFAFRECTIRYILTNSVYTGELILQKSYVENPLTKKRKINNGELDKFIIANHHEPIIDKITFDCVQKELVRRSELGVFANKSIHTTCLTSKIKCSICGNNYRRITDYWKGNKRYFWGCKSRHGLPRLREPELKKVCSVALGIKEFDEQVFLERVKEIAVIGKCELQFNFYDGASKNLVWEVYQRNQQSSQEYVNIMIKQ